MNTRIVLTLALALSCSPAFARAQTAPADPSSLVAPLARWESGQGREPIHEMERLVREAVGDKRRASRVEAALIQLLASDATPEARRFACQQLAVIGSDASVPALAALLNDPETAGLACLAFGNRPSAKINAALRSALDTTSGRARLQIISTLGHRRDVKAVKALTRLAHDTDIPLAQAAIRALGETASPAAARVLADLRRESRPELAVAVADASLRCADRFIANRKTREAAAICDELLARAQPDEVRRGAFLLRLRCDADGGVARILDAIHRDDALLKPPAIAAVGSLPSKTASEHFARLLPALAPEDQANLIQSLAARADEPARTAIVSALKSSALNVRLAAADALGQIGNATTAKPLARALLAAKDADEIRALTAAIGNLPAGRETDAALLAEMQSARGEARARLITALAPRRTPEVHGAVFAELHSRDELAAIAAWRVLARAADRTTLPELLRRYATLPNAEIRSDIEAAVEQAVSAVEDVAARSKAVRDALPLAKTVGDRCAVLSLLPAAGDTAALAALLEGVSSAEVPVRDCSVYALSQWPDLAAWDAMYRLYREPAHEAHRTLMLRSLVRLLGEANAKPDAQLIARYRDLVAGARDAADLKQILGALGGAAQHPVRVQGLV
ncbi:MAG: HEAT repeat domain-containing protein [Verrucomicrobiae bacterium]|nr:HEAT repeat domain-containing protein [Verrucomicrobiae bacterium]